MFDLSRVAPRRFIHLPVTVRAGQLVCLSSGLDLDVQAGTQRLWLTAANEPRDVFVAPGQHHRIGERRCGLISADAPTRFTVRGEANHTTRISLIHANGERQVLYPTPRARPANSLDHSMNRTRTPRAPSAALNRGLLGVGLAVVFSGLTAIVLAETQRSGASADTRRSVVARCDDAARSAIPTPSSAQRAPDAQWRRLRDRAFAECLEHPPAN